MCSRPCFREPPRHAAFGLAQLALDRRAEAGQMALDDVVVRAGFHRRDGDVLSDGA